MPTWKNILKEFSSIAPPKLPLTTSIMSSTEATLKAFIHRGPFNETSCAHPTLAFLEKYAAMVDACDFSGPSTRWYSENACFFNQESIYASGPEIWKWMAGSLFGNFGKMEGDLFQVTVIELEEGKKYMLLANENRTFWMKGKEPVTLPRALQFTTGLAEDGEGEDGWQHLGECRVWWNPSLLMA